jgi:hypothetical protein
VIHVRDEATGLLVPKPEIVHPGICDLIFTAPVGFYGASNKSLIDILTDLSLTTNLKICLDAGDINSYDGSSADWADVSGNIGADEFFRGSTSGSDANDPTFNGSAGGLSANEYWSFDGADYFTYGAGNETYMDSLHKASAKFAIITFLYFTSSPSAKTYGTLGNDPNNVGAQLDLLGTEPKRLSLYVGDGSGPVMSRTDSDGLSLSYPGWHVFGGAFHEGGGNVSFFYGDTGYDQVSSSDTFSLSYSTPSSSAATYPMQIGTAGNAASPMPSGSRQVAFALWSGGTLPTKANFDDIVAGMNKRGFGI